MIPAVPQPLQDAALEPPSSAVPVAKDAAAGAAVGSADSLTAQALLAGRPWVGIEHNGQHYRLQTTRAGKLILTK